MPVNSEGIPVQGEFERVLANRSIPEGTQVIARNHVTERSSHEPDSDFVNEKKISGLELIA